MSYFSYGAPAGSTDPTQGIVIPYIFTESQDDTPIMSEDGTEYLYTERDIKIRGVINGQLPPALIGETPSITLNRVRQTLETPRLQLFFFHNNQNDPTPLCQSPAAGFGVDVRYGPIPQHIEVWRVAGSECLMVRLEYKTWVLQCVGSLPYISHRWTESIKIDRTFKSTKTRTGKIYTRADIGASPDALRGITSPPLDPGFIREHSEYTLQSDGLALSYTYVDEEQFLMPPLGSVKADGWYKESTPDGGQRWGECMVHLIGPKAGPFSDKANLLATAIQICVQKLDLGGSFRKSNEGTWLAIGGVEESLWENEVRVQFRTIINPIKTSKTNGVAVDLSRFNVPLFGVDSQTQLPGADLGSRGSAQLMLIANALNDPCLGQSVLQSAGQSVLTAGGNAPTDTSQLNTTTPALVSLTAILPNDVTVYDSADTGGAYKEYKLRTRYLPDEQIVVLSTAKSGAPAAAVQLGQGTLGAVTEFSIARYNETPVLPPSASTDPNLLFLRAEVNPEEVEIAGDGVTPIYKVKGRYLYHFLDRSKASIAFPVPPYIDQNIAAALSAGTGGVALLQSIAALQQSSGLPPISQFTSPAEQNPQGPTP